MTKEVSLASAPLPASMHRKGIFEMLRRFTFLALASVIAGFALFGTIQDSTAAPVPENTPSLVQSIDAALVSAIDIPTYSPISEEVNIQAGPWITQVQQNAEGVLIPKTQWVVQAQEAIPGTDDDLIVNAFQPEVLPTVVFPDTPPWPTNAEGVKCQQLRCLVDIPGWSSAIVVGGYQFGEPFVPTDQEGHAVILHNVGEAKVSFGYTAFGPSYVIIVPYPDGRPQELANYSVEIVGYIANIGLNPDRTSPIPMEWNNQCHVHGCSSMRIAGYLFAHADRPESGNVRFIHYFRTTIEKVQK